MYNVVMQPPEFKQQRGRFANISTAYWVDGNVDGAPMILLHGLGGTHGGLMQLAEQLTDYHLFMPDVPGHGGTAAPNRHKVELAKIADWFEEFMNSVYQETGKKPVVVAHSYGTFIAFLACQHKTAMFEKCIMISPVEKPAFAPKLTQKIIAHVPRWLAYMMATSRVINFCRHYYFLIRRDYATIRRMQRAIATNSDPHGAKYYAAIGDQLITKSKIFDSIKDAHKFYCIAPSHDKMVHHNGDATLSHILPADHIRVCPRSGHMMPFEAPGDAAEIVRDFVEA